MALKAVGTAGTATLAGIVWSQDPAVLDPTDVAALTQLILDDQTVGTPVAQDSGVGGLEQSAGKTWVPNRGSLVIYPGDVLAVDTTGGVILITELAAAGGDWVVS